MTDEFATVSLEDLPNFLFILSHYLIATLSCLVMEKLIALYLGK